MTTRTYSTSRLEPNGKKPSVSMNINDKTQTNPNDENEFLVSTKDSVNQSNTTTTTTTTTTTNDNSSWESLDMDVLYTSNYTMGDRLHEYIKQYAFLTWRELSACTILTFVLTLSLIVPRGDTIMSSASTMVNAFVLGLTYYTMLYFFPGSHMNPGITMYSAFRRIKHVLFRSLLAKWTGKTNEASIGWMQSTHHILLILLLSAYHLFVQFVGANFALMLILSLQFVQQTSGVQNNIADIGQVPRPQYGSTQLGNTDDIAKLEATAIVFIVGVWAWQLEQAQVLIETEPVGTSTTSKKIQQLFTSPFVPIALACSTLVFSPYTGGSFNWISRNTVPSMILHYNSSYIEDTTASNYGKRFFLAQFYGVLFCIVFMMLREISCIMMNRIFSSVCKKKN